MQTAHREGLVFGGKNVLLLKSKKKNGCSKVLQKMFVGLGVFATVAVL